MQGIEIPINAANPKQAVFLEEIDWVEMLPFLARAARINVSRQQIIGLVLTNNSVKIKVQYTK